MTATLLAHLAGSAATADRTIAGIAFLAGAALALAFRPPPRDDEADE